MRRRRGLSYGMLRLTMRYAEPWRSGFDAVADYVERVKRGPERGYVYVYHFH